MFVVDDEQKEAEKEGGEDVTEDDFPLEMVEVGQSDIDQGGQTEEENTDGATDGVDQPKGPAVFLEASFSLPAVLRWVTLHQNLQHLPLIIDSVIDTEVILKPSLQIVQRPVADEDMFVVPGLDGKRLALLGVVKEAVAETQVGEAAVRDG